MFSPEALTYPFIFLALYFESFLLVTFLSKPARERRAPAAGLAGTTPQVAIIVSVWNEETTIGGTIESLLALEYPSDKLSLILVNDGSTDGTAAVIDRFAEHPQITAVHKAENGGKFTAMNIGIEHAKDAELIGFLDADSFVAPDALKEIVNAFADERISAVTASMSIHKPQTILQRMQYAEYALSITLRHAFASVNSLYVTPGPFSFYRRAVFEKIGLFKHAYLAEDMEMAMRMQRAGMSIGNAIRARVYTKGPPTFRRLLRQRIRWTTGFLRNVLFDYRDLLGNRQNATLGLLVLPLGVMAICAGIFLFIVAITQLATTGYHAMSLIQTVPLSYTFTWRPLTWFYLPITMTTLLGLALTTSIFTWMIIGKRISKTPGKLALNALVYLALYGIVTPIWLMYSVSDVALGTRTPWR